MKIPILLTIIAGSLLAQTTTTPITEQSGTVTIKRWKHDQGYALYECFTLSSSNKSTAAFQVTITFDIEKHQYVDLIAVTPDPALCNCRMIPRDNKVNISVRELIGSFTADF